jgi:hypothetical protein
VHMYVAVTISPYDPWRCIMGFSEGTRVIRLGTCA